MINPNMLLGVEGTKVVMGLAPLAPPSTSRTDIVSMKNYNRCLVIILVNNTTTGVTGTAITLTQSQDVSNTGGKALAFTQAWRALNCGTSGNTDTLSNFAVVSNTFTTDTTSSVNHLYVIEIMETDLDVANSFDCVCVALATGVNCNVGVVFVLYPAKYGKSPPPSAIID